MKTTPSKRPIKILFEATPMVTNKTGVAYYTERLAVSMAEKYPDEIEMVGFYYNFLGRRDSSHLPRRKNLRYTRASFIPSKIVYQLRRWGIEFPIELLTFERADFILYPNFLSQPTLFGTPSAPVIHDLTYLDLPQYVAPKLRRDLIRFIPKAIQRSKFVITVSDFSKRGIIKTYGVAPQNVLVTPIPPAQPLQMSAKDRQAELKAAGITKPFILFLGTIDPRKNVIGLVDSYLGLPKNLQDKYSLVLVGRIELLATAEVAKINEVAKAGRNVIHLGYVSDQLKEALYQSAVMFAHASKYEGFGMPVLEAMAYGLPCALSGIPVFREVGGDAAVYFDWKKPTTGTKVIADLLKNPEKAAALGARAKAHASTYSWDKVAKEVVEKIRASLPR